MLLRLALIVSLAISAAYAHDSSKRSPLNNTILVIGDSLSAAYGLNTEQGWVNLLRHKLSSYDQNTDWNVINASISGDTSASGLLRLNQLLDEHQPVLCILALGANDGLRGLSITNLRNNLDSMVKQCNSSGESLLVGIKLPPNYGNKYTQAFHQVYEDIVKLNNISYVPFMLEGFALKDDYFQADGLHPTSEAQPIILENIWAELRPLIPNVSPP